MSAVSASAIGRAWSIVATSSPRPRSMLGWGGGSSSTFTLERVHVGQTDAVEKNRAATTGTHRSVSGAILCMTAIPMSD